MAGSIPKVLVLSLSFVKSVVTKTWNDLKPPKTINNNLQPPTTTSKNSTTTYNHLQPPQKHLQPLVNTLKPSKTR